MKKRPAWLASLLVIVALVVGSWLGLPLDEIAAPLRNYDISTEISLQQGGEAIDEEGWYDQKDDVALYIHTYGRLPDNYITKSEARELGWDNHDVRLNEVAPGKSIGGDRFGNREGLLPDKDGRTWTECDIDASDGVRGVKRIVFSNDGMVFYTDDHYESFERLY